MSDFWHTVENCMHEWTAYWDGGACVNEYCQWNERHCRKCHVYQVSCACGTESGKSGWPHRRWVRLWHKRSNHKGVQL